VSGATKGIPVWCPACKGRGVAVSGTASPDVADTCPKCNGCGLVPFVIDPKDFRCPYCNTVRPELGFEIRSEQTLTHDVLTAVVFCKAPGCGCILPVNVLGVAPAASRVTL